MTRIDLGAAFGNGLLKVEKPARYLGGEYGAIRKDSADFRIGISFPDLYEIGMSNQALKILYGSLNRMEGVACERVFAPGLDFEKAIRERGLPLCSIESGVPLDELDMLAFTVGYELCGTGILNILDLGRIPLRSSERRDRDPLVIGGGMALTNPRPFAEFFDAIWIGEAEAGFFGLVEELRSAKKSGADRGSLIASLAAHPAVWTRGKKARRAVFSGFGEAKAGRAVPVPTVKVVQDHGVVEIMRGCPNGCRFCHAGFAYRPCRMKRPEIILEEVDSLVRDCGYKEITLTSLSSGDYSGIDELMKGLSEIYSKELVSFQLPSLRVSTFSLPLIESLGSVRKSGLTFAIETPKTEWQLSMNKDVSREKVLDILLEAKKQGWKSAKFYFMIGLPSAPSAKNEVDEICSYLVKLQAETRMEFSVNVGIFVPKPHTPYERSAQLGDDEALECLLSMKRRLPPRIRLSFHSPFVSMLEGIISRGDERSGEILLDAFRRGLRLEAWEEHREMDAWKSVLSGADREYIEGTLSAKSPDEGLFWDSVDMGVSRSFLAKEFGKSVKGELSGTCAEGCGTPCGSCNSDYGFLGRSVDYGAFRERIAERRGRPIEAEGKGPKHRLLFRYSKLGIGKYYSHLNVVDAFMKAFARVGVPAVFTQGFNPQPKLEIAHPLAMGIESKGEEACLEVLKEIDGEEFVESMNSHLPDGLRLIKAKAYPIKDGRKNPSLASLFRASAFSLFSSPNRSIGDDPDLAARLSAQPGVRFVSPASDGAIAFVALNGKGKDEQALSPMKSLFGEDISDWPRLIRSECLISRMPTETSDIADRDGLVDYMDFFDSYYR